MPIVAAFLMFLQANLLVVSELHHHQAADFPGGQSVPLIMPDRGAPTTASNHQLCTACQIVRQGAALPAVAAPAPAPLGLIRLFLSLGGQGSTSSWSNVGFGRAPPLA